MNYTHVICQFDTIIPIGVVDDFDDIKKFIYDYHHKIGFGINKKDGEYSREYDEFLKDLKFTPFDGYYEYTDDGELHKYRVYCSDHYKK
jgi:hypothetical protein